MKRQIRKEQDYFFAKFCEPPNRRMESIKSSCDTLEFVLNRSSLSIDARCLLFVSINGVVPLRTVVVVAVSPPLPIRRTVRYSVIVFPNGFGATIGGDGCCDTGEALVISCLRSLSTVTLKLKI